MNHEIFSDFLAWLKQYDPNDIINFRVGIYEDNPTIRFNYEDFNDAIYEAAVNRGFDVDYCGFSVYVIAQ